jgi:hypothetical protein
MRTEILMIPGHIAGSIAAASNEADVFHILDDAIHAALTTVVVQLEQRAASCQEARRQQPTHPEEWQRVLPSATLAEAPALGDVD